MGEEEDKLSTSIGLPIRSLGGGGLRPLPLTSLLPLLYSLGGNRLSDRWGADVVLQAAKLSPPLERPLAHGHTLVLATPNSNRQRARKAPLHMAILCMAIMTT